MPAEPDKVTFTFFGDAPNRKMLMSSEGEALAHGAYVAVAIAALTQVDRAASTCDCSKCLRRGRAVRKALRALDEQGAKAVRISFAEGGRPC